uniref:NADH-ubiquinone oxidoreductase chain 4 n=1 Tax=Drilonius striatulus TaxID=341977 RepID=A0A0S2MRA6_9COLE|nr:NADH deshydrogenase subunit 4 [Drilonius striatulus]
MMKFILFMIFLIPQCLFLNFWFNQLMIFVLLILFFSSITFSMDFSLLGYGLGCDLLGYMMIVLSIWICSLMVLSSEKIFYYNFFRGYFLLMIIALMIFLVMVFCSLNLFIFYLFFEMSLIPVLIIIMGWGYQPERIQAGVYLLFYTMFGSLPMIIVIFYANYLFHSLDYYFLGSFNQLVIYICFNFVFFIKAPMFLVHLWLPKAHVEAPISGSMILAGVMLKLGGYGLMRFMIMFSSMHLVNLIFLNISLLGGLIVSLICLRQNDIKSLIAYSSVSHMSLMLGGVMTLTLWGYSGSFLIMISHGLCSSGLFCLSNMSYERIFSRSMFLNKGFMNMAPSLTLWWFLLCSSNMAAPPSLNLIGEIFLLNSLVGWDWSLMLILMLMSFFSGAYSLYLYSYTQHGKIYSGLYSFSMGSVREYLLLMLHWLPLNILFLLGDSFYLFI